MNPLDQYPGIRRALYFVQWVVNGVLGVIGVVLAILGDSPLWYVITAAAFNFVWSYAGVTAQTNVTEGDIDISVKPAGEDSQGAPVDVVDHEQESLALEFGEEE